VQTIRRTATSAAQTTGQAGKGAAKFATPVASAAVGVIGGVLLGRGLKRQRKVLGIPVPGADGLSKQVREAGKQFGKLAKEVRMTREKAEEVGKAIS
jgi:hypothetical protein